MPISIIFVSNFPKNLRFESELFENSEEEDDNSAFEKLKENIVKGKII